MKIEVGDKVDKQHCLRCIELTKKLTKIPRNTEFYFLNSERDGEHIISSLHKHAQKHMRYVLLKEKCSFSYSHKKRKMVVILMNEKSVRENKDALVGLLLHEVTHLIQKDNGLYKYIDDAFKQTFLKNKRLLNKLSYPREKIATLFDKIGYTSILLLKELFVNSELINTKRGKYLVEFYRGEFLTKQVCPRPVFYDKFKDAAQRNLDVISVAFEFEFSLLSILLPFERYETKRAEQLTRHINQCYEMNVQEVARKCHELIYLYLHEFAYDKAFCKRFFNAIFNKVYLLLV